MAVWKQNIILFGGFYDPGYTSQPFPLVDCRLPDVLAANYLNDLWLFDMQEYKWRQIVMKDNERKPSWVFNISSFKIHCPKATC